MRLVVLVFSIVAIFLAMTNAAHAGDACPNFQPGTYTCKDRKTHADFKVDLKTEAQGLLNVVKYAITGQRPGVILCANKEFVTNLCTWDARLADQKVDDDCHARMGEMMSTVTTSGEVDAAHMITHQSVLASSLLTPKQIMPADFTFALTVRSQTAIQFGIAGVLQGLPLSIDADCQL